MGWGLTGSTMVFASAETVNMAMRHPTEDEIRYLVGQVVAGELCPLDSVLTKAIWGDNPPATWGEWPKEAIEAWSFGCHLYLLDKQSLRSTHIVPRVTLTLDLSWRTILGLAPDPVEWWSLPGVTWLEVGHRLGLLPRKAAYRMMNLGWRMKGSGMRVPDRRVVAAPCNSCGAVWTPREMERYRGPCCLGDNGC